MGSIDEYCRCCMASNIFLFDMNSILRANQDDSASSYFYIYSALIIPEEALTLTDSPPKTCQECSLKIETIFEFSKSCQKTNRVLIDVHKQLTASHSQHPAIVEELITDQVDLSDSEEEIEFEVDIEVFKCNTCGETLASKGDLDSHEMDHLLAMEMFECSLCTFVGHVEEHLSEHFKAAHKITYNSSKHRKTVDWNACQQKVVMEPMPIMAPIPMDHESSLMVIHSFKTTNSDMTVKDNEKISCSKASKTGNRIPSKILCAICRIQLKNRYDALSHAFQHTKLKQFQCSRCDYKSNTKKLLVHHLHKKHLCKFDENLHRYNGRMDSINKLIIYEYDTALDTTPQTINLVQTVKSMKSLTDNSNSNLKKHVSNCSRSSTPTNRNTNTQAHLKGSQNTKNQQTLFVCSICLYQFKKKSALYEHINRIHLQRFKCKVCSYKTDCRESVEIHVHQHLPFDIFHCLGVGCTFESSKRHLFIKHLNTHLVRFDEKLHTYSDSKWHQDQVQELIVESMTRKEQFKRRKKILSAKTAMQGTEDGTNIDEDEEVAVVELNEESNNSSQILKQISTKDNNSLPVYVISNTTPNTKETIVSNDEPPLSPDVTLDIDPVINLDSDDDEL